MKIDAEKLIQELDALFAQNKVAEAGDFLDEKLILCREIGDRATELTVLNELIGYHRRTGLKEKALTCIDDALNLLKSGEFDRTVAKANTFLNSATTLKSYGLAEKGLDLYEKAKALYDEMLSKDDYRLAGFYNNYGLALCDTEQYEKADESYQNALKILERSGENKSEIAVTYCNIAFLYEKLEKDTEINRCLDKAMLALDDPTNKRDGYYAFNCEKSADAFRYFGRFIDQWTLEERAKEIYENNRNC